MIQPKEPPMIGDLEPGSAVWFWAAAATIIATLASAVAALYKAQISMKDEEIKNGAAREECLKRSLAEAENKHDAALAKLGQEVEDCRKDREELRVQMARFETRLGMLEKHDRISANIATKITGRLDDLERQQ